ncbi:MAG: TIGR02281 family clan AA aspartic protease, partial [Rickettsiaceae bacterium]|nr:TIGR02281 family clan AA aspartic protease [Rickettsiaceae bacterium]
MSKKFLALIVVVFLAILLVKLNPEIFNEANITTENIGITILSLVIITVGLASLLAHNSGKEIIRKMGYWFVILFIIVVIYAFKAEFEYAFQRVVAVVFPSYISSHEEGKITVARSLDGHFYINIKVNGRNMKFMVDTGASDVALSKAAAKRLNIDVSRLNYNKKYSTANGISWAAPITLDEMQFGAL